MEPKARRIFREYVRSRIDWWHRALHKGIPTSLRTEALRHLGRLA